MVSFCLFQLCEIYSWIVCEDRAKKLCFDVCDIKRFHH